MFSNIFKKPKLSKDLSKSYIDRKLKERLLVGSGGKGILKKSILSKISMRGVFYVFLIFFLISGAAGGKKKTTNPIPKEDFIARIVIDKPIIADDYRNKVLTKIKENEKIKGVLLVINSPGGTLNGSEVLYNKVKKIAKEKPVIATVQDIAVSGSYMLALAADQIFANKTSMIGSIGVLMEGMDARKLAEKIGIKRRSFASSKYKAEPSPLGPLDPDVKEYIEESLNDAHKLFSNMVQERRNMSDNEILKVNNAKVFLGQKAQSLKLVDKIGGEDDATAYLKAIVKNKGLGDDLKVLDMSLKEPPKNGRLIDLLLSPQARQSVKEGFDMIFQTEQNTGILAM